MACWYPGHARFEMKTRIERFIDTARVFIALGLLFLYLVLAWVMRIEDPFGEEQEHKALFEQLSDEYP